MMHPVVAPPLLDLVAQAIEQRGEQIVVGLGVIAVVLILVAVVAMLFTHVWGRP